MKRVNDNLTIFGESLIDEKSIGQIQNCISDEDYAVLTADAHYGYGHPIGGAVAYKNKISVSGVGFDIACGNKAVETNIMASDVDVANVMDEIFKRISFGVGRPNNEPVDHEVNDKIAHASLKGQRKMAQLAASQLGTVGSGNHFVDLFVDPMTGLLWIGVHFGSRGFGHKTAMGFIALSQGLEFGDKVKQGSMDEAPILLDLGSELGQDYFEAMELAGDYAYAGRDLVVDKVLEILGGVATKEVHNHHNFAWMEEHFGEKYCVVRKGCTPAFPGQEGFVGATMADTSVIIQGLASEESQKALYSSVHGAGRVMSRREAAGKIKFVRGDDGIKRKTAVSKGKVDFDTVQNTMKDKNIVLRGAGADEAPECYKKLALVLAEMGDTVEITTNLKPIGVAMAGDEIDPYKD